MNIQLHDALRQFREGIVGTRVRGLPVESVELIIDTNGEDTGFRFFLYVHFTEPDFPENMNGNLKMLHRVFNDVNFAVLACLDVEEVRSRMVGMKPCHDHEWILEDELMDGDK